MIFSRLAIKQAINQGLLAIDPLSEDDIEAAHVNLHLGGKKDIVLAPRGFVLAETSEHITMSGKLCGFMEGKAGLAKQGISIEQSSTFIEPGSDNKMTLEIFNASNEAVTLRQGQSIAKLFVMRVVDAI